MKTVHKVSIAITAAVMALVIGLAAQQVFPNLQVGTLEVGQHVNFKSPDVAGKITLSGGAGTVTFNQTFAAAPFCVGTDQTAANAVKIAPTTTTAVFAGTTTDVIAYVCIANQNGLP